jgi:putative transposase
MKGDIFHILNRGVEKRKIFLDNKDYYRFLHNLEDFNNKDLTILSYNMRRSAMRKPKVNQEKLVDILCWCLMPNHYHILVQEIIDGGASIFSKKLTSGYTQYFNLKNKRIGVLFQGRSKIIPLKKDEHFIYIPYYIFSNPIKLLEPHWKERGLKNSKHAVEFIDNYQWLGIINRNLFYEIFDITEKEFKKNFNEYLQGLAMR